MKRMGIEYTLAVMVVAAVVSGSGALLFEGPARDGVGLGAGAAFVVQASLYWALFVRANEKGWGVAHGIGALVRFVSVALMALVVVPQAGLPAAPTLLSFVVCLFVSTLLEPVFLKRQYNATRAGATTIRTEL